MWRKEFDESYAVPDVIDQHPKLVDVSWHNDAAPSFSPRGLQDHEDVTIRLFVQHPDPAQREMGDSGRFIVVGDDGTEHYDGDDADAAVAALLRTYATWRKANPTKATKAAEARRKALQAAEDAAEDARQQQHAATFPSGCREQCGACAARITYGLTVGSEVIVTNKRPWSGPERHGWETVTMRVRISRVRTGGFDYVGVRTLDVSDPLPGGANDGEAWRTRDVAGYQGGMTWSYAVERLTTGELRIVKEDNAHA